MLGIRVIQLQEVKPASPLHWLWIRNRRVGDIVALINATLAQTQRVGPNPAIPPAPVTAAAGPSRSPAFSSTEGAEAVRPPVQRPINSRRFDHAPELHALFFPRVPLGRWKCRCLIGIAWIGDDVMDHLVANSEAIRSGDRVILAMVSNDASGR
jgi:hypothetical protein